MAVSPEAEEAEEAVAHGKKGSQRLSPLPFMLKLLRLSLDRTDVLLYYIFIFTWGVI